jgi:glutamate racemase
MDKLPIGIFDSGVGGLTVVKEIIEQLPNENIVYLGDTARIPYGTRDNKTIKGFAKELTEFINKQDVKLIVVACNTMSAVALREIESVAGNVPVVDVISPMVNYACSISEIKKLAVIGTRATISSGEYEKQIKIKSGVKVVSQSCPLFVPLVEEGLTKGKVVELIIRNYLNGITKEDTDGLILGCTHYPALAPVIKNILGKEIKIIDSGFPTALEAKKVLAKNHILNKSNVKSKYEFYVTDNTVRSFEIAQRLFDGKFPGKIKRVKLG